MRTAFRPADCQHPPRPVRRHQPVRARTALRHTLADMIRRYVDRWKKARGGVKTQGGGGSAAVKKFAMKHPFIMAGAVLEGLFTKTKA